MASSRFSFGSLFKKIHSEYLSSGCSNIIRHSYSQNEQIDGKTNDLEPNDFISSLYLPATKPTYRPKFKKVGNEKLTKNRSPPKSKCEEVKHFRKNVLNIASEIKLRSADKSAADLQVLAKEFSVILNFCLKTKDLPESEIRASFEAFQDRLSEYLEYRESRIIFYFIYAQYLQLQEKEALAKKELKLLQLCNEYSRHLGYFYLAMKVCFRMHKILFCLWLLEESKEYLIKAMRLAVFLRSQDDEYRAIDMMKMVEYYEGIITNENEGYFEESERAHLLNSYHPLDDLDSCNNLVKDWDGEDGESVNENVINFCKNMIFMRNTFTERSSKIAETVKKIKKVGFVEKYLQDGTHFKMVPLVSHKSQKTSNQRQILITQLRVNEQTQRKCPKSCRAYLEIFADVLRSLMEAYRK